MTNGVVFRPGIVTLLALSAHPLFGGVVLDGSFGTKGALPGPNFTITANMGKLVNTNLFQSFSQFNLNSSQSATFTGPNTVQNILARVTSGSPSSIDGRVSSQIPGANLFFMNPAGVLFGQHAQLNVSGSVAVTTANYLNLVGGGRFNANLGGSDVLTSAPVSAFGFLSTAPAGVSIAGSTLNVAPLKSFSAVAGDITMTGGKISGQGSRANLVSVKSAGEAELDATDINSTVDVSQFTAMGTIDLLNKAAIQVSGPATGLIGGGSVFIRAGTFTLDDAKITANTASPTLGHADAGLVDVQAGNMSLTAGGQIVAGTNGKSDGGDIKVAADSLLIDGKGVPFTGILALALKDSTGNGGNITMNVNALTITNGGTIAVNTSGSGNGGEIDVAAESLLIGGGSPKPTQAGNGVINAGAFNGDGGDITVSARHVTIFKGGEISASTSGKGHGGNIVMTVDSLVIDGMGFNEGLVKVPLPNGKTIPVFFGTGILALGYGEGAGGNIALLATGAGGSVLNIVGGGQIATGTFGTGDGGSIDVATYGSLLIDGTVKPGTQKVFGTGIFADVGFGSGGQRGQKGGLIVVHDDGSLTITNGGTIEADTFGRGDAGDVNVTADSVLIDGKGVPFTGIRALALKDSTGNGGTITVFIPQGALTITNGGTIAANTSGSGIGGEVNVTADSLLIGGGPSMLTKDKNGTIIGNGSINAGAITGRGGQITVEANLVKIFLGGEISTGTTGTGNAGSIKVTADSLLIDGMGFQEALINQKFPSGQFPVFFGTGILAIGYARGHGGSITVGARQFVGFSGEAPALRIVRGGQIAAGTFGKGNGGNIELALGSLLVDGTGAVGDVLFGTGIFAGAEIGSRGNGGEIIADVTGGDATITAGGQISSSALGTGKGGSVSVAADSLLIDGTGDLPFTTGILADAGSASTTGGGSVDVQASTLTLTAAGVIGASTASTFATGKGGDVTVTADEVKITDSGEISSGTFGRGHGGRIDVTATSLRIDGASSGILANAGLGSNGDGGSVTVDAGNARITASGEISANTLGTGKGGSVSVAADSLLIDGTGGLPSATGILANAGKASTKGGGSVDVQASNLTLTAASVIGASTASIFGSGKGGDVTVNADEVKITDSGEISASTFGAGKGGDVTVMVDSLTLTSSGAISSGTFGSGFGGTIDVTATSLRIDGANTGIFANAEAGSSGNGGKITVKGSEAEIKDGGEIAASTFGPGDGGSVTVTATNSLLIDGSDSGIFAVAGFAGLAASGIGGDVFVNAGDLSLQNRGAVSAASFTPATGGSLHLSLGTLSMDSGSSISSANSSTNNSGANNGSGEAGSVTINTTGPVTMKHGSTISTASTVGDAGNIDLTSSGEIKLKDSSITASAGVNGGDITITAPGQLVYLVDSSIIATAGSSGSSGTGGNITIDHPQFIVASNSLISANATVGTAGNVFLNSEFLFTSNSTIFATGTINITAPALDLGAQLITLPSSLLSAENQLQERCAALLRGDFSSFISIGRGGTEPEPEELQITF